MEAASGCSLLRRFLNFRLGFSLLMNDPIVAVEVFLALELGGAFGAREGLGFLHARYLLDCLDET
jgi:hypothetical protein